MAGQLPPGEEMCIRILPCKARRRGRQRKGLICKCERLRAREDFRMSTLFYTKQLLVQVALPDYKGLLPTGDKSRREGLSSGTGFT